MAQTDKFQPNNTITHRYAKGEVLQQALIDLGFKKDKILIKATSQTAFEMQLPRVLEKSEKNEIFKAFIKAHRARQRADDETEKQAPAAKPSDSPTS